MNNDQHYIPDPGDPWQSLEEKLEYEAYLDEQNKDWVEQREKDLLTKGENNK